MNWFKDIKTRKELKSKFRELAKIHHPDHGGDTAVMQTINDQYEAACVRLAKEREAAGSASERKSRPASKQAGKGSSLFETSLAPAIYRKPAFSHKDMCLFALSLFVYGELDGVLCIRALYRLLCLTLDPVQTSAYRDYVFNRKIAVESLKKLRKTFLRRFSGPLWNLFNKSKKNLERCMEKAGSVREAGDTREAA